MGGLTHFAYDNYVAKDFSKFTAHNLREIAPQFPQHPHWLKNCFLNTIVRVNVEDDRKPVLFTIIRRVQSALSEHELAKRHLDRFVASGRSIDDYFGGLSHLEISVSLWYQANEIAREAVKRDFFRKGDGSVMERANRIYSVSKHGELSTLSQRQLHPLWLTNEGINCSTAILGYAEINSTLAEMCGIAHRLSELDVRGQWTDADRGA